MKVLVDTSVWSLALRRKRGDLSPSERGVTLLLSELIQAGEALLIGPIRQEILSGIGDAKTFESLRQYLRYFDDEALTADDYEEAAHCYNRCKAAGIAGSGVDMLLCAVAARLDVPILTTDADFYRYAKPLRLRVPTLAELQEARSKRKPGTAPQAWAADNAITSFV